ncbi:MAG TPA: NAD(P)/FAD-dependent oxidoreductase [Vicinamibacterales bacterium]|nr:NAD(P)/FAD-dependent oxidoreductase [Vicinamibacterales bacterium]
MGSAREKVLIPSVRDVAVIGGGPAGLIAARNLAAAGRDVVVLEEHEEIGVPVHCTGLLGSDAFDELDLPRTSVLATAHSARFVAADGSSVLVDAERVRASIVDRARFDQGLAAAARAAGAEIRCGERVRRLIPGDDGVTTCGDTAGSSVRARVCVLACGASYRFNRELGFGVPQSFIQSAQLELPFDGPDEIEVHLGRGTAPGGFAWVVPFRRGDQRFNRLGLMCEAAAGAHFEEFASRVRATYPGVCADLEPRMKMLPLAPVPRTFGHRVLAVGDAAGLVKPTTGGGIYYGLVSGDLAARVLDGALRDDDLSERRLKEYETRWRQRLGPEIRTALAFRALMLRLNDGAINALVELARVDGLVPLLRQTADFNWHRRAALSLLRHAQFRRIILGSLWS